MPLYQQRAAVLFRTGIRVDDTRSHGKERLQGWTIAIHLVISSLFYRPTNIHGEDVWLEERKE